MLLQILLGILLGILVGTLTGLIPGIHINLASIIIVSLASSLFFKINSIYLVVFIVSMSITHTFIDFIPSILLGCPDTDTELSILPGHEFLKEGRGYQAILLTLYGSLAAIFILIVIAFPLGIVIKNFYNNIVKIIPFLLLGITIFLIYSEKNKLNAVFVVLISGVLGYLALNYQGLNQPFLPLLTGLFGASNLILTIKNKTTIPKQEISKPKVKLFKPLLGSLIASPVCTILPGLGAGQASIIGHTIANKTDDKKGFLVLLGATNTLVMGFSFITLFLISKTRTGSALAVQELIGNMNMEMVFLILFVILITGIISFYHTKYLAKKFVQKIQKINYTKISITILLLLSILTLVISGFIGLIIFIASTLTGIYCISLKVRRTNMMGCLLIPTIILYLF